MRLGIGLAESAARALRRDGRRRAGRRIAISLFVVACAGFASRTAAVELFGPGPIRIPLQSEPVAFATADFDGDGSPDLAAAGTEDSVVLLGDGLGGYAKTIPLGLAATLMVTGDFDGNGSPDIGFANGPAFGLLRNDGAARF